MKRTSSPEKRKKQVSTLENIHGAMGCYLYMTLCIVVFVAIICGGLFVAERLFPKYVHVFNYSLSSRAFVELEGAHRYKAAVDFYEQKKEVFTTHGDKYETMIRVSDCYKRIGEYEKSEAILRELLEFKYLTDKEKEELEENPWMLHFFKFGIAKELFNLYEAIGDIEGQKRFYSLMKDNLTDDVRENLSKLQSKRRIRGVIKRVLSRRKTEVKEDSRTIDELIKIYDLKMLYLSAPDKAIMELIEYSNKIANDPSFKPSYVQKCINLLINWLFEQTGDFSAYTTITTAVEYTWDTDSYNTDKSEYGNLSDICYKVHDIKNSKRLYSIYSAYLEDNTSKEDPEYINNQIRGFKFLEAEQDWAELEKDVISCCEGLRELLGKNILTMSESQREHFVELLDKPFNYAADLLVDHPSENLASLCLDNTLFMRGLLLRSNRETANRIRNSGEESLLAMYDTLIVRRKELSYREGLGRVGNAIRMNSLRKEVEELDKQLAISCEEYRVDLENAGATYKSICRALDKRTAMVDFIHTDSDNLLALIITSEGKVHSTSLGTGSDLVKSFPSDIRKAYSDPNLTSIVWNPVEQYLSGVTDIFYATNGVFNSISFQALGLGDQIHLIDKYQFHLLSNLSNILNMQDSQASSLENTVLAMWGDIDYGGKTDYSQIEESIYREIERGEGLSHLVFSKDEIDAIQTIVEQNRGKVTVFAGSSATEASFRSRAGKKDDILHISTHGFFTEDDAHRRDYNPMYNSGLFFAGADSTWNRVDTTFTASAMIDDGILRADEIQYLDFSGCHIAVLSACKTGHGQSKNREGVYGLQRAFKLAGVEKVLMSLWSVNDKSTAELMQEFYRNLSTGMSDEDALREAQSAIRSRYPSPEDWGAFVLLY